MKPSSFPIINRKKKTIEFHIRCGRASHVSLAGTFNHWSQTQLELQHLQDDNWKIVIPLLPKGKYLYKFFIDDVMWMEDIENPDREPDGVTGWNSVLNIRD